MFYFPVISSSCEIERYTAKVQSSLRKCLSDNALMDLKEDVL
jgi:hypothetical protein